MKFSVIASGSKGNACVVSSQGTCLLIDCGTTQRYLKQSLGKIDLNIEDLDALLITHDHSDHTRQVKMFRNHLIYSPVDLEVQSKRVYPYEAFALGAFTILPIRTSHDAEISVGYVLDDGMHRLVYITDTGYIREKDYPLISNADFYVLESNHDPSLLMKTNRPYTIKRRILSESGHLSNEQSASILSEVVGEKTKEVFLAHLSEEANTEGLAYETVRAALPKTIDVFVARQHEMVFGGKIDEGSF